MQTTLLSGQASVAQSDARPTGDQEVMGLIPANIQQLSFVEIGHEIFSVVVLSVPLIQEGQLLFYGERMCTSKKVNLLED